MFVRVTTYKMKPDMIADAMAKLEVMKDQIMGMTGVIQFTNSINDDGTGCVMSLVESRETSDANAASVQQLWSQFADHLAEPPQASGYEVIAHWSN